MKIFLLTLMISFFSGHVLFAENEINNKDFILAGSDRGLYYWDYKNPPVLIFDDNGQPLEVRKIIRVSYGVFILTSKGIFFSIDGLRYEARNKGINIRTIKYYRNGIKSFSYITEDLKDLEVDPYNDCNLIACCKGGVYISTNAGREFFFMNSPVSYPSIKSVAIFSYPSLQILVGHSFKGLYYKNLYKNQYWKNISSGIPRISDTYEEVSDIKIDISANEPRVVVANNFTPILYQLNLKNNRLEKIADLSSAGFLIESLFITNNKIYFVNNKGIYRYEMHDNSVSPTELSGIVNKLQLETGQRILCLANFESGKLQLSLSELWAFNTDIIKPYFYLASGKNGLYVQASGLKNKNRLNYILNIMEKCGLNMLVVDMKDDWGYLRFKPEDSYIRSIARVVNPLDLEGFMPVIKKKNIYMVARMVVFKDKVLYHYNNGIYAVKNTDNKNRPWQGIKIGKNNEAKTIEEYWVDPYCEKVWEYNVAIAKELSMRGFDEIQFDYIRFPTDGINISKTFYEHKENGMDMESAIMSFLQYARENLDIPISIDIYGANGFYRTGSRTGQDVEIFKNYVDVICPMFYPSHFSQDFLDFAPYEIRPYRIYYYGSLRNFYIGRKEVVIRPYVQAFKLNVSYDRKYYGNGIDYIKNEIKGIEDSINQGYTFWNMGMNYSILTNILNENEKISSFSEGFK